MARPIRARRTRKYSQEFKYTAVQLSLRKGILATDVAEALGIHPAMLWRWRQEFREGLIVGDKRKKVIKTPKQVEEAERIKELEAKVAELEKENDLLKKWQRFLAEKKRKYSNS